jgi:transketolase
MNASATPATARDIDRLCIDTLRFLAVDMVQRADSGHPGLPLDAAPMAYVLWDRFLRHNPENPHWFDRDRFILSAGHGSALLYALLHLTGYDLGLDDLKSFRQWNGRTPGHPERGRTPGVEMTTGPLGQGFGNGVGMAIAEAHLAARFNRPGHGIVDHYTYALVSDGDLMEGVASEAASLAGHLRLGKLVYLYDRNRVTLSSSIDLTFTEDVAGRFRAYGWQVLPVVDGNDCPAIFQALTEARRNPGQPSLIIVDTHIGYGSPGKQDSFEAHGAPLGVEEVRLTKRNLGWPEDRQFHIPEDALQHCRQKLAAGRRQEEEWRQRFEAYRQAYPDLAAELEQCIAGRPTPGWETKLPVYEPEAKGVSTRAASGKTLNAIAAAVPSLLGGSGDLNPSTYSALKGMGDFESPDRRAADLQGSAGGEWGYAGRNLWFGVREHAMGAALNGLAAHGGLLPYGATFLNFSDYLRPTLRLAAMMALKTIYIFTHDSIGLGEDGPTHQPIEQLPSLRAIPRLVTIRPADANEAVAAWRAIVRIEDRPVALILTRQNLPVLDRQRFAPAAGLLRGAYVLADPAAGRPDLILIATGSEVSLIVEAAASLAKRGIGARLVSMPSWELFDEQDAAYRDGVLPPGIKPRLAVEAASPLGWERYVGEAGAIIGLDRFGASAPGGETMRRLGFTAERVCERAMELLGGGGRR